MGPHGQGPLTGRRMGRCRGGAASAGARDVVDSGDAPRFGAGFGRGAGHGRGRGFRHRHWYFATGLTGWERAQADKAASAEPARDIRTSEPLSVLREQASQLERSLTQLKERIAELWGEKDDEAEQEQGRE